MVSPIVRFAGRVLAGASKIFNTTMSIRNALNTAHAQEMRVCCPAGEHNWITRRTFCDSLSEAIEKTPIKEIPAGLGATVEPMLNNIIDAAICERTTLSIQACRLVGNLPKLYGRDFQTHIDRILPVLIHQTATTKAVASKAASAAVSSIIYNTAYTPRFLYHVCQAFEDKYTGPKINAPEWLKLIITDYYTALNPERDYDTIAKAINIGLLDADNNVRVNSRATFWAFHKKNPTRADSIIENLHAAAKTALMNDKHNPEKMDIKSKKPQPALAQIKKQKMQQLQQKTEQKNEHKAEHKTERNRVVSTKTIASEDFPMGQLDEVTPSIAPSITPSITEEAASSQAPAMARPLLSAPIRRPRIVATPMNIPYQGLKNITNKPRKVQQSEQKPVASASTTQNTNIHDKENIVYKMRTKPDPNAADRITINDPNYVPPYTIHKVPHDGLTLEHRLLRMKLDQEIQDMGPGWKLMAAMWDRQDVDTHNQQNYAYPDLNHDGYVADARRAFIKALDYLRKDALDQLGFRKLRKLLEQFGRNLITDQEHYDQLMNAILPKIGIFEDLIKGPTHELNNENAPRYVRHAIVTMLSILIHDYPFEWSYQYQGPALAAMMIARCAYSVNCDDHEGQPYVTKSMMCTSVNTTIQMIIECCLNPVQLLESVLDQLNAYEAFLIRTEPHISENTPPSFFSYNPYSKNHRDWLQEAKGASEGFEKAYEGVLPTQLPLKAPLLMETGLKIIRQLIRKAYAEEYVINQDYEDRLVDLGRRLLQSYSVALRQEVMAYFQVVYKYFGEVPRFWSKFDDSEKNLLFYYLEKAR